MSVDGGNGNDDRRREDRRVSDRRIAARGTSDRRRQDRRARTPMVLLAAFAFLRGAVPAGASELRPGVVFASHSPSPSLPLTLLERRAPRRRGPTVYRSFIDEAAAAHGVNVALVEAVIHVESAFNPRALSNKGAQGLMQLMPDTATRFGVKDAFDPRQNIRGGTRYLAILLAQFGGDVELACAAYNAGERVVLRYGGIPPYRETQQYVSKINRLLGRSAGASAALAVREERVFYTWRDPRGVLNASQFPPRAGQAYETHRLR